MTTFGTSVTAVFNWLIARICNSDGQEEAGDSDSNATNLHCLWVSGLGCRALLSSFRRGVFNPQFGGTQRSEVRLDSCNAPIFAAQAYPPESAAQDGVICSE